MGEGEEGKGKGRGVEIRMSFFTYYLLAFHFGIWHLNAQEVFDMITVQIKLASVKLAMKYMKRVSAELETVGGGPEEEELIVQGVRFAFRVHQVMFFGPLPFAIGIRHSLYITLNSHACFLGD